MWMRIKEENKRGSEGCGGQPVIGEWARWLPMFTLKAGALLFGYP
jgi:hypothetical protein